MTVTKKILTWFDQHGRKNLPWQHDKTPYRVWVSEIMLQQTQVSTVIAYFQRFMSHFPTIETLANADEDTVLHLWTGLGYYSRARNLHRTAKIVCQQFHGQFPDDLDTLKSLPGIGLSTAGAILAIAFEKQAAILDGNVKRVLCRIYGIQQWPGEKEIVNQLWALAGKLTPKKRVADYTQAIMDLGATLCTRGTPRCPDCPLLDNCLARQLGIEKKLPSSKPRKTLSTRQAFLLILQNNQHVLLEKRPAPGIWGGLWSLPELTHRLTKKEIRLHCQQRFHIHLSEVHFGKPFCHSFSHFHLTITPVLAAFNSTRHKIMDNPLQLWYNLQHPPSVGLPQPIKKLLGTLTT